VLTIKIGWPAEVESRISDPSRPLNVKA